QNLSLSPLVQLYKNPDGQKERSHIDRILQDLAIESYRRKITKDLLSTKAGTYFGAWYELMVYNWLVNQGKNLKIQPTAPKGNSKLDFLITTKGASIYIDVASVQESVSDNNLLQDSQFHLLRDFASFDTMKNATVKKLNQHKTEGYPYIICLGLESPMLSAADAVTCLLGNEVVHIPSGRVSIDLNGELFRVDSNGLFLANHELSGVLVCHRNRQTPAEGYRLVFCLIENPYATYKIDDLEFATISRYTVVSKTTTHYTMAWQNGNAAS
ncbi:MAG: hypothetical protein ABI623_08045, partial [bacterium]